MSNISNENDDTPAEATTYDGSVTRSRAATTRTPNAWGNGLAAARARTTSLQQEQNQDRPLSDDTPPDMGEDNTTATSHAMEQQRQMDILLALRNNAELSPRPQTTAAPTPLDMPMASAAPRAHSRMTTEAPATMDTPMASEAPRAHTGPELPMATATPAPPEVGQRPTPMSTTGSPAPTGHAPTTNQAVFTPAQHAVIQQMLHSQKQQLDHLWQGAMDQKAYHMHTDLTQQHAQQMALMSASTDPKPLYTAPPCSNLKFPGPNQPAASYKNYLTLLEGELGLNQAMERFLRGQHEHPIKGQLLHDITNFFHNDLHKGEWVFDRNNLGYTIAEVERTSQQLASRMRRALESNLTTTRNESYNQLNKCLFMAIHRGCDAVSRDKDFMESVEHGKYEHIWDGYGLYTLIQEMSKGEHGADEAAHRIELMDILRNTKYQPGTHGIRSMFAKIKNARSELSGLVVPTHFDDATILKDIHTQLEISHNLFTDSREAIENNADMSGIATTMASAQRVHERFEKRLLRIIKKDGNPAKRFPKMDLTNVPVQQTKVKQGKKQRRNKRFENRTVYNPINKVGVDDGDNDGENDSKRARGGKHCVHHPQSKRGSHSTEECKNPYSRYSLWADQGNEPLTNKQWQERQEKSLGPPQRTHGRDPISGADPDNLGSNPTLNTASAALPPRTGHYTTQPPRPVPPHLAVNYTTTYGQQQQQQQQQLPPGQEWILVNRLQTQTMTPQQRADQFRQVYYMPPAEATTLATSSESLQPPAGWSHRTLPVQQIQARNTTQQVQPVDGMQRVLQHARQHGQAPRYATLQQTQNFGRGGALSRRI